MRVSARITAKLWFQNGILIITVIEEVEKLVERITGEDLLSDQKIWQIVSDKALTISQDIQKSVVEILAQGYFILRKHWEW